MTKAQKKEHLKRKNLKTKLQQDSVRSRKLSKLKSKKRILRLTYFQLLKLIQHYPQGMTATELSKISKWSRQRVEYHLKAMSKNKLLVSEKQGNCRFYSLNPKLTGGVSSTQVEIFDSVHAFSWRYDLLDGKLPQSKHHRDLRGSKRDYFYFEDTTVECYRNKPLIIVHVRVSGGGDIETLISKSRTLADAAISRVNKLTDSKLKVSSPVRASKPHYVLKDNQLGKLVAKYCVAATESGLELGDKTPDEEGTTEIIGEKEAQDFEWLFKNTDEIKSAAQGYQTLLQAMMRQENLIVQNTSIMQGIAKILQNHFEKL